MKRTIVLSLVIVSVLSVAAIDRFYIEDFTIAAGETCRVSILLDNEMAYTAFQSDIYLPEGLSTDDDSFNLTDRKTSSHTLTVKAIPDGTIRIMSYSLKLKTFSGNSGALVTFNVTASNDFEGPVIIAIRNTLFTTEAGVEIPFIDEECAVTTHSTSSLHGDVNGNNHVNISDVTALINYLLSGNAEEINIINADTNNDGKTNISDVTTLINYLLSGNWPEPEEPPFQNEIFTVNGVTFTMVGIEGGTFTMGATPEQGDDALDAEKPAHQVTLSSYAIGETEVTQALWEAVMGSNPSRFSNRPENPVEGVTWLDCQAFIAQLNQLTGKQFRLPTEAEWEFAARGGNKSQGYKYAGSNDINEVAWYTDNSTSTQPVSTKKANELGLYDMSGNVWEWCQDYYGDYSSEAQTNPTGPETGTARIRRGVGWNGSQLNGRVSHRSSREETYKYNSLGLRLAL